MTLVKEFYATQIETRGDHGHLAMSPTGTKIVLRFDDKEKLSLPKLAEIFQTAAKDYPTLQPADVQILADRVEFSAKPKADYKRLPAVTVAAQG